MNYTPLPFTFGLAACLVTGCATRHDHINGPPVAGTKPPTELIAFYSVPLRCPAAPEIGCGSRAKPVLRELERGSGINEAWLNRAGTQLAVVWTAPGSSGMRMNTLDGILKKRKLTVTELTGKERAQALKEFQSGTAWHRADAMDRLSEEEAGIIATRIVRRIQLKMPLPEAKAETLRSSIADTLKKQFVGPPEQRLRTYDEERQAFLESAARYLNESELAALRDAVASGYRPLPGEQ